MLDRDGMRALLRPAVWSQRSRVAPEDLRRCEPADWATPQALLSTWLQRLAAFDVLVVPGRSADGRIHAAKVIAPGLEVETLSYGRIGERVLRRLLERDSPLVGLGPADRPGRRPIVLDPAAQRRVGAPAWFDSARADDVLGSLYPLYREPRRHAVERLNRA